MNRIIWTPQTPSTHIDVCRGFLDDEPSFTVLATRFQTSGRGQRGNSWEAAPGLNLTFSMIARPCQVPARLQFAISEAMALAICDALDPLLVNCNSHTLKCSVKWPNDIYVGHQKICGILIEHSLNQAGIIRSVLSAGINVNQERFLSNAPNPVSLLQLIGIRTPLETLLEDVATKIEISLTEVLTPEGRHKTHSRFMKRLYRGDGGLYGFFDHKKNEAIEASIHAIEPDGTLTLTLANGQRRSYLFKEVSFRLP